LVHGLLGHAAAGGEEAERPGIVHRLDRDTSGLLVVARSEEAHRRLQGLLRQRKLVREYVALVRGRPRSRRGRIEAPVGRDRGDPKRVSLDTDTPREAVTNFEDVETYASFRRAWRPAMEGEVHPAIEEFVETKLPRYVDDRDFPSRDGTSRLSPLIASGEITIDDCAAAALAAPPTKGREK